jgi:hypothetical protein
VARKDRARARKRHAIERARRQAGTPPPDQGGTTPPRQGTGRERSRAAAGKRPPGRQRDGRGPARGRQYAVKGKVGDVATTGLFGRRQVVRTRNMFLHPKITVRVILAAFGLALPGIVLPWFGRTQPNLQPLTFAAFALCFLGLADLAPTLRQTIPLTIFAALSLVLAVAPLLV